MSKRPLNGPLVRTGGLKPAGHPMGGTDSGHRGFGVQVGGPPTSVTTQENAGRPAWFRHAGSRGPREGFMGAVGMPTRSGTTPPSAVNMDPSPDMPEDVTDLMTNPYIPYMRLARHIKHQMTDAPARYQVMMTKREDNEPVLRRKATRFSRRYTTVPVPALNFMWALNTAVPASPDDVETAEDVMCKWFTDGVVKTEVGDMRQQQRRGDVHPERGFNNVQQGYAFAFNVWGTNVQPGTRLWLIVKKVPIKNPAKTFKVTPWNEDTMPLAQENRTERPFQISYYGHYMHDKPPLRELEYLDEFGNREYGVPIYMGRASTHTPVMPNYRETEKAHQNIALTLTQPQFHFFVDWQS